MDVSNMNTFQFASLTVVSLLLLILFNHLISLLLLNGTTAFTGTLVAMMFLFFFYFYWFKYIKKSPTAQRPNLDREFLMNALRSVETSKIPYVVDRFLELDRAGETNKGQQDNISVIPVERRCVVCLHSEACIRTLPCAHRVACGWCAWQSLKISFENGAPHRCVICRTEIEDFTGSLIKNLMNIKWKDVRKIVDEIESK